MEPKWLVWGREIQAIAQIGLAYAKDAHDHQRYERLRQLAARMIGESAGIEPEFLDRLFSEQIGYATPKVDVRGAVFKNGQILLVQERADAGRWALPGGWADVNQSPRECVIAEVLDEAGLEVVPRKLAAVYDRARHPHVPPYAFHIYKMFFICEIVGGTTAPGAETESAAFFDPDKLPPLSVDRVLDYQIERMFTHLRSPDLPTDYD
ncbi:NUDIX hydrolase [Bradyrhizobium sp. WSM3983]|uniref:NUDIX hydrolase n=1 Tax=Bradyrhizobium sp. WSM3983 TaxID=1038867 RepID=UPI0004818BE6|nr:NUDIX hydrolase [Bradyrhizobium sp. WSM3983]